MNGNTEMPHGSSIMIIHQNFARVLQRHVINGSSRSESKNHAWGLTLNLRIPYADVHFISTRFGIAPFIFVK